MASFSEVLKELRENSGLTQEQLAEKLEISKSAVSMYERGEREPSFEVLEAIADTFNVDMNRLHGREHSKYSSNALKIAKLYDTASDDDKIAIQHILKKYDNLHTYRFAARDGQKEIELTREQREEMAKSVERAKGDDLSDLV